MLLLDTHAVLWLDSGEKLSAQALDAIDSAAKSGGVLASPVSAWEIGMLVSKKRISLDIDALEWFQRFLALPGVRLTPLSVTAAIESSRLPEPFHGDPADCLLVATARELACPIVTRDRQILDYADGVSLHAMAC